MQATSGLATSAAHIHSRPHVIFFCELTGTELLRMLSDPRILSYLVQHNYGIALAIRELDADEVAAVRLLNQHQIQTVAWLLLPEGEGLWLSIQNYPQAIDRYRRFRNWAIEHQLRFQAIGLDVEPPESEVSLFQRHGLRNLVRRLWLAAENVLFSAAQVAYNDLVGEIHHDGYEVHTYQLPILADDRRAGTTLLQRSLDIIDIPADVEVLICYSSLPLNAFSSDIGGAFISNYGSSADAIGVGCISDSSGRESDATGLSPLSWEALERDLLLAAQHTDTLYLFSLEGCVERGLMHRLAAIDWQAEPQFSRWKDLLLTLMRSGLFAGLLVARFRSNLLAWLGWVIAAILFLRQLRHWRRNRLG